MANNEPAHPQSFLTRKTVNDFFSRYSTIAIIKELESICQYNFNQRYGNEYPYFQDRFYMIDFIREEDYIKITFAQSVSSKELGTPIVAILPIDGIYNLTMRQSPLELNS